MNGIVDVFSSKELPSVY